MIVYHSYDDYQDDISWFEFLTKKKFFSHEACWNDPRWKALPARFLAGLIRANSRSVKKLCSSRISLGRYT